MADGDLSWGVAGVKSAQTVNTATAELVAAAVPSNTTFLIIAKVVGQDTSTPADTYTWYAIALGNVAGDGVASVRYNYAIVASANGSFGTPTFAWDDAVVNEVSLDVTGPAATTARWVGRLDMLATEVTDV